MSCLRFFSAHYLQYEYLDVFEHAVGSLTTLACKETRYLSLMNNKKEVVEYDSSYELATVPPS